MKFLFLHALPFDGRMWDATREALPYESVAPDLYGAGDSIQAWASAALAQAGSDDLIVVGCSVGGSCALAVAEAAPDQVTALVLVGAKAGVNRDPDLRDEAIRLLEVEGVQAAWERYWLSLFAPNTPRSTIELARGWATDQGTSHLVNGVRAFHDRRDCTAFAQRWDRPLIGISGDHDRTPPAAILRDLTRRPARAFHLVERCGHYVNLERPEVFNSLLDDVMTS